MKRVALLLSVVFVLGALAGVGLVRWYVARTLRAFLDGNPDQVAEQPVLYLLDHEIGLSPTQRARASEILRAHRDELRALHRQIAPQVIAIRAREVDELLPSLDENQRGKLIQLRDDIERRAQKWLGN